MNVYDFDGTIYKKDCSVELYMYVLKKKPFLFLVCLPIQIMAFIRYFFHIISKEKMKEGFFCFLQYWDIDFYIDDFVEEELKNINDWYLKQRRNDDVIISASPMFLIEKFAKKINIQYVIASEVDKKTGKFSSLNCHGEEKVRRFLEKFPENEVDVFYSDSESDQPLAKIAKIAYKVHGEQKKLWMLK